MALHSRLIHIAVAIPAAMRSPHVWSRRESSQRVDPAISDDRHDEGSSAPVVVTRVLTVLEETNQA